MSSIVPSDLCFYDPEYARIFIYRLDEIAALAVYDTTRAKLSADSVEVTYKLAIPQYKKINSKYICLIDGEQHEIYNIAHTTTKDGFKESELTLKTPAYEREVIDDTERTE